MHMVGARLGFEKAMVGTGRATPCPDCMDRLRNTTLTLQRAGFWQERLFGGCMATDSADYYMLVNEWMWSKSRDFLLRPEVQFWSQSLDRNGDMLLEGMCGLKVVRSEKKI